MPVILLVAPLNLKLNLSPAASGEMYSIGSLKLTQTYEYFRLVIHVVRKGFANSRRVPTSRLGRSDWLTASGRIGLKSAYVQNDRRTSEKVTDICSKPSRLRNCFHYSKSLRTFQHGPESPRAKRNGISKCAEINYFVQHAPWLHRDEHEHGTFICCATRQRTYLHLSTQLC